MSLAGIQGLSDASFCVRSIRGSHTMNMITLFCWSCTGPLAESVCPFCHITGQGRTALLKKPAIHWNLFGNRLNAFIRTVLGQHPGRERGFMRVWGSTRIAVSGEDYAVSSMPHITACCWPIWKLTSHQHSLDCSTWMLSATSCGWLLTSLRWAKTTARMRT